VIAGGALNIFSRAIFRPCFTTALARFRPCLTKVVGRIALDALDALDALGVVIFVSLASEKCCDTLFVRLALLGVTINSN
jgi:hypothetical protein